MTQLSNPGTSFALDPLNPAASSVNQRQQTVGSGTDASATSAFAQALTESNEPSNAADHEVGNAPSPTFLAFGASNTAATTLNVDATGSSVEEAPLTTNQTAQTSTSDASSPSPEQPRLDVGLQSISLELNAIENQTQTTTATTATTEATTQLASNIRPELLFVENPSGSTLIDDPIATAVQLSHGLNTARNSVASDASLSLASSIPSSNTPLSSATLPAPAPQSSALTPLTGETVSQFQAPSTNNVSVTPLNPVETTVSPQSPSTPVAQGNASNATNALTLNPAVATELTAAAAQLNPRSSSNEVAQQATVSAAFNQLTSQEGFASLVRATPSEGSAIATPAQQLASLLSSSGASENTGPLPTQIQSIPLPQSNASGLQQAPQLTQPLAQFANAAFANDTLPAFTAQISRNIAAGQDAFNIRLNPSELGRVDVRLISNEDGSVNTQIRVERTETLDLFQRDIRALERTLQQSGVKLGSDGIDLSLKDNGTQQGGGNQGFDDNVGDHGDRHQNHNDGLQTTEADQTPDNDSLLVDDLAGDVPPDQIHTIYARYQPGQLNIRV